MLTSYIHYMLLRKVKRTASIGKVHECVQTGRKSFERTGIGDLGNKSALQIVQIDTGRQMLNSAGRIVEKLVREL